MMKTNAARALDALGIAYQLRSYEVDLEDLSATSVASKIGMPAEQVFKTLVAEGDRTGVLIAVVPANAELDLKALAKASGNRSTETVPLKPYTVFVDETIELFDEVSVSAGVRGTQLVLAPGDYLKACQGTTAAIAK
jgi:Cys-tRNA(Pro)/Cys-tRNA(Cys) deacylase